MKRALLLLTVACSGDPVGSGRSAILNGNTDTTDTSVVALFVQTPSGQNDVVCSGTVVSPHVVLTAAHCLDPDVIGESVASVLIFLGDNFLDPTQANNVAPVAQFSYDTEFSPSSSDGGHDVAVVIAQNALSLAPVAVNHDSLGSGDVGTPVVAVGFGQSSGTDTTSAGPRRYVDTTIFGVDDVHLMLDDVICEGDSGGPTLMTKNGSTVIAGLHSFTTTSDCIGPGDDTRVDLYTSSFIDPAIQNADPGFLPSSGCNVAPRANASPLALAAVLLARRRKRG